ncbi:MAG: hypothetical protein Ta2A_18580 [Treponemataceae bacterium]|nr:MAG: hypothetical protein Ta2A_18580 [Treponemataceae bacterium]
MLIIFGTFLIVFGLTLYFSAGKIVEFFSRGKKPKN